MLKHLSVHALLVLLIAVAALPALAQKTGEKEAGTRDLAAFNLGESHLAIQGYDPVAYFPEGGGAPKKGDEKLALEHEGVVYHFASEANREAFKKEPEKYEPQHGGWCSYAMAKGKKVEIDPNEFSIRDGRLFLLYSAKVTKWWKDDETNLIPKADTEWKKTTESPAPKGKAKAKGSGSKQE
ncbi:MAG: YHS domain-containing protein [Candidatus Hydrogenedentes bacterium]|nr:YHS domain-containing protein [Candidatus Hydrogenedentota bacterium]